MYKILNKAKGSVKPRTSICDYRAILIMELAMGLEPVKKRYRLFIVAVLGVVVLHIVLHEI